MQYYNKYRPEIDEETLRDNVHSTRQYARMRHKEDYTSDSNDSNHNYIYTLPRVKCFRYILLLAECSNKSLTIRTLAQIVVFEAYRQFKKKKHNRMGTNTTTIISDVMTTMQKEASKDELEYLRKEILRYVTYFLKNEPSFLAFVKEILAHK